MHAFCLEMQRNKEIRSIEFKKILETPSFPRANSIHPAEFSLRRQSYLENYVTIAVHKFILFCILVLIHNINR